jgi:alpha-L-fucosidase
MNFKIVIIISVFYVALCNACTVQTDKIIQQDENYWIVLNSENAKAIDGKLSWDFALNRTGNYDVQVICDGELSSQLSEVKLETAGVTLNEIPEKIFVIGEEGAKQTVFQFGKNIIYKETGLQTLSVEAGSLFKQIRITPTYKNKLGFGSGKYETQWQEMHNSPEKQAALAWLNDAKYGMFIHWGLYSQAGGIWKGVRMEDSPYVGPGVSEWLMFKFRIPRNEYAELAKTFNPDKSFAQNIAKLAKDAGMKYVVITSKHHDGFALFDSKCSDYDMVDATPYKADAIKELYEACLAEGLEFGVYYSHGNDWNDGTDGNYANVKKQNDSLGILSHESGKNLWDPSQNTFDEYIENKSLPQIKELLQAMPKLRLVWFDGDGNVSEDQSFQFYKAIFDINPNVLVSRRVGYDFGDYLDAGDNVIPSADDKITKQWETCGTTNNSWAYKSYDNDWKSTSEMLYYLIDIASKGGNYLLNIGPDGFGHVPEQSAQGLSEVGQWLKINGEAIYGTTRWKIPNEGQEETLLEGTGHREKKGFDRSFSSDDFWFTAKENKVYAIALAAPIGSVEIKSLKIANGVIEKVSLLGCSNNLKWEQKEESLTVVLPDVNTEGNGYVLEITLIK